MTDIEKDAARWNAFVIAIANQDYVFLNIFECETENIDGNIAGETPTIQELNAAIDRAMERAR